MRTVLASVEVECRHYRSLAESAFAQLSPEQLGQSPGADDNAVATIAWHIAGNLRSRFTDFLTSDGEKPDRDRDSEFLPRQITHAELLAFWSGGWDVCSRR